MTKEQINKLKFRALLIISILILFVSGIRLYDDVRIHKNIVKNEQKILTKQIEHNYTYELNKLKTLLVNRALHLASLDSVVDSFENKERDKLYLISSKYYQNIKKVFNTLTVMHFHLPDNTSFLRVHKKNKFGDNLKTVRLMIDKAIKSKEIQTGFEGGLHDNISLTYRITVPVFSRDKNFIGILELGLDFEYMNNIIQNYLESLYGRDVYILNLINKDFFKQKIKEDRSSYEFGKYVILESDTKAKDILNYIKVDYQKKDLFLHIEDKAYSIIMNNTKLEDYKLDNIGTVMCIIDDSIQDTNYHNKIISSIIKPMIVLIIMLFATNWLFGYFAKFFIEANQKTKGILDVQSSMILLTNGVYPIECNKTFLEFIGYETLDEFTKEHNCICDYFEKGDGFIQKDMNGTKWTDYIEQHKDVVNKVQMTGIDGKVRVFQVDANVYSVDNDVITFLDITELENIYKQLSQQSKQAAMGEMIGNIAHQWRQPLSAISTAASGMKLQKEFNNLSDADFEKLTEGIIQNAKFLSETIEDFKNFIKADKVKHQFILSDIIKKTFNIVEPSINNHNIAIVKNIDDNIKLNNYDNELVQVILNIFNNARDVLVQNVDNEDDRFIFINSFVEDNNAVLTIKDTADGIPSDIINKVFEPYFTTKHQSQGTGLGLYMSHQIIVDSMDGSIGVENETFTYNDKSYTGAKFIIKLPL